MRCPYCNADHPAETRFCPNTGLSISDQVPCPNCGSSIERTAVFCPTCGVSQRKKKNWLPLILTASGIVLFLIACAGAVMFTLWLLNGDSRSLIKLPGSSPTGAPLAQMTATLAAPLQPSATIKIPPTPTEPPHPTQAPSNSPTKLPPTLPAMNNSAGLPSFQWSTKVLDPYNEGGQFSNLLIDAKDTASVVYLNDKNDKPMYAVEKGSSWFPTQLPERNRSGWCPSIASNSQGALYISAWVLDRNWIIYYNLVGGRWISGPVLYNVKPASTAIFVDSLNRVNILFLDKNDGWTKIATLSGSGWLVKQIFRAYSQPESIPGEGANTATIVEENGDLHIASYSSDGLVYLHLNKDGTIKAKEIVDQGSGTIEYPSLALSANGTPVISYYDLSHQSLKLAARKANTWYSTTIDDSGNAGQFSSLKVNSTGIIYISYYDAQNKALKFASISGDSIQRTEIDRDQVGKWSSLAIDSTDLPKISYYDEKNHRLKIASANFK